MGLPRAQDRDDLQAQAMLWATPTSHPRSHDPRQVDHGEQLANQVNQWQSPQSRDWKDGSSTDFPETLTGTPPLGHQAPRSGIGGLPSSPSGPTSPRLWSTPRSAGGTTSRRAMTHRRDGKGGTSMPSLEQQVTGQVEISSYPKRLNPLFVEWLMGMPLFWTELRAPRTQDGGTSARRAVTSGGCKTTPPKSSGSDDTPVASTDSAPSATPSCPPRRRGHS